MMHGGIDIAKSDRLVLLEGQALMPIAAIKSINCVKNIFSRKGKESFTAYVSEQNLFIIRPTEVMSKKLNLV